MTKLRYLNLSDNNLLGSTDIFEYLGKLDSLEVINLDRSSMSGNLQNTGIAVLNSTFSVSSDDLLFVLNLVTYYTVCILDTSF